LYVAGSPARSHDHSAASPYRGISSGPTQTAYRVPGLVREQPRSAVEDVVPPEQHHVADRERRRARDPEPVVVGEDQPVRPRRGARTGEAGEEILQAHPDAAATAATG